MGDTFASAAQRLVYGATQGAIGGAVFGAIVGSIFAAVRPSAIVGAEAAALPASAAHLWRDSEYLGLTLAALDCIPPACEERRRGLVAAVDQLLACREASARDASRGERGGTIVHANRCYQVVSRILRDIKSSSAATELLEACDTVVYNMCME